MKKRFWLFPDGGIFRILGCLVPLVLYGVIYYLGHETIWNLLCHKDYDKDMLIFTIMVFIPSSTLLVLILSRYELFGTITIQSDGFLLRAPFRIPHKMAWNRIEYVGIDYGVVSGFRQFWIYFSMDPIPPKYIHWIHQWPMSYRMIRFQYNKDIFDLLIKNLPDQIGRKLNNSYSIIREFRVDE